MLVWILRFSCVSHNLDFESRHELPDFEIQTHLCCGQVIKTLYEECSHFTDNLCQIAYLHPCRVVSRTATIIRSASGSDSLRRCIAHASVSVDANMITQCHIVIPDHLNVPLFVSHSPPGLFGLHGGGCREVVCHRCASYPVAGL